MKHKSSPINAIFFWMIAVSIIVAGFTGNISNIGTAVFEGSKAAAVLCLGLIGPMALWLGIMKVAEVGGLMKLIAHALRPIMKFLFPDLPLDHPATGAIIMNMAANMLGLGNAATPLGIKAMQELDKLNPEKGTATDAMALFLAINTSSIALLPIGVITFRAAAGSNAPESIFLPSLLATMTSTTVAVIAAKTFAKRSPLLSVVPESEKKRIVNQQHTLEEHDSDPLPWWIYLVLVALFTSIFYAGVSSLLLNSRISLLATASWFIPGFKALMAGITVWLIPLLLLGILIFGVSQKVKVYEVVTDGAKEGFETAKRIIPFMVAIIVSIRMVTKSGTLELIGEKLEPLLTAIGMPIDAVPMALIRPLSGSGASGVLLDVLDKDPNNFVADLVSVMSGSTETTFYVLAVYFGAIGVKRMRHALPAALMADVAGIAAALFFTKLFLG